MKIIEYANTINMVVEFQDKFKYKTSTTYCNFRRGTIKNPYDKTIYKIGYIGVGEYKAHNEDSTNTKPYDTWTNMLERCYNEKMRYKHPAYEGCTVCKEWQCFQTFAKWYEENYYDVGNGRMHLDKDILVKNNKIYSPDTCLFVPQRINMIFMKKERKIDADLPTGIRRAANGFQTSYNGKYLGVFKSLEEALICYNIEKRLHINKIADEYRDKIPYKLYYSLINWDSELVA